MKAKKYYQCDAEGKPIRSTFNIVQYAADHPNKRNSLGETFNEELARVIHQQTQQFGYDRHNRAPVKRDYLGKHKVVPIVTVGTLGGALH